MKLKVKKRRKDRTQLITIKIKFRMKKIKFYMEFITTLIGFIDCLLNLL